MPTRDLSQPQRQQLTLEKALASSPNRARARISAETTDRMGDVVVATGARVENYLKNPVVLYGHNSQGLPIGKTEVLEIIAGVGLDAEWEWAPTDEAQVIAALWDGGFLNATSIGFLPLAATPIEDDGSSWFPPMKFNEWELLEFSVVPVPANQDALRLALEDTATLKSIISKAGRVLSAKNEADLRTAADLIAGVIAQVAPQNDDDDDKAQTPAIEPVTDDVLIAAAQAALLSTLSLALTDSILLALELHVELPQ